MEQSTRNTAIRAETKISVLRTREKWEQTTTRITNCEVSIVKVIKAKLRGKRFSQSKKVFVVASCSFIHYRLENLLRKRF